MKRSHLPLSSAASRTLAVPSSEMRIVRAGIFMTVSTPAIDARCTTWVDAVHGLLDRGGIHDVAFDQLDVGQLVQPGRTERVATERVEHADAIASPFGQVLDEMRADEAGAAGEENVRACEGHRAIVRDGAGEQNASAASATGRRAPAVTRQWIPYFASLTERQTRDVVAARRHYNLGRPASPEPGGRTLIQGVAHGASGTTGCAGDRERTSPASGWPGTWRPPDIGRLSSSAARSAARARTSTACRARTRSRARRWRDIVRHAGAFGTT